MVLVLYIIAECSFKKAHIIRYHFRSRIPVGVHIYVTKVRYLCVAMIYFLQISKLFYFILSECKETRLDFIMVFLL